MSTHNARSRADAASTRLAVMALAHRVHPANRRNRVLTRATPPNGVAVADFRVQADTVFPTLGPTGEVAVDDRSVPLLLNVAAMIFPAGAARIGHVSSGFGRGDRTDPHPLVRLRRLASPITKEWSTRFAPPRRPLPICTRNKRPKAGNMRSCIPIETSRPMREARHCGLNASCCGVGAPKT